MKRSLLVAQRELLENARTKGFWIGILMMPIMLVLLGVVPMLVESTREAKQFAVIDKSGWLLDEVRRQIEISDLSVLLSRAGAQTSDVPDAFATLSEALDGADQIQAAAAKILNPSANTGFDLPDAAGEVIERHGSEMADFWRDLSPMEKAALSPGISTNRLVMVQPEDSGLANLNDMIQEQRLFAYFIIGSNPVETDEGLKYVSNNLTDRDLLNWFTALVNERIREERLNQADIDEATAAWIAEPVSFEGLQISREGQEQQVGTQDIVRQWAPVVFVYLLWISILLNTQMLLTNMIEEKSNKLIEVLLSSISAIQLMAGKIIGIALTGLIIIGAWGLMAMFFFILLPSMIGLNIPLDLTSVISDPVFIGSFFVYFVLGYLLYAAILVGLGSVCSTLKDAQNLMLPVQLVQVIPILVMIPIGRDPNGTLAQIMSYIPPLTPFVMMNRAAAPPTTFEYVVTTALLIGSIALVLWLAARVFRIGILLTGKPPGFMEILRWFRPPATRQGW